MIRLLSIFLILSICTINAFSQKLYEWKPPTVNFVIRNDVSFKDTLFLIVKDRRVKPEKLNTDTDSEQITSTIVNDIKKSFPRVVIIDRSTPKEGSCNVLINLASYGAGFGTEISAGVGIVGGNLGSFVFPKGKWNAITALTSTILKPNTKESKDFSSVSSKDNIWGYKSSRKALEETYSSTINQLLLFIEDSFTF
ncbi:hypothetical protein OHD16_06960 [Sphingobacterium sp. ML3W]|uniref:hypothetical protein n=1 Tax=Sphingobacterium sp. ML3W TaxID=1538644 RepID=UPI00249CC60E|nr:hypothetical protein [Sphingobacterium sp. ML3W]WFA79709.1 hypothetical protein OGI71_00100 [Sphingobacterium sp. ML3W]